MNREDGIRDHGLTVQQIAQLQERLQQERATLTRRLATRRSTLTGLSERRADDADWASDSADQGLLARLVDRDAKLLHEVNHALAKFSAGTYGLCELSDEPIGFERLQVRPWSRHAVVAKEQVERRKHRGSEAPRLGAHDDDDDRAA
jgi:DnaK suppressor protein